MASKKRPSRKAEAAEVAVAARQRRPWWPYAAAAVAGLFFVFWAYGPSMRGPFLFDDNFALPDANAPVSSWIHGVRPLLMCSYWLNARSAGGDTYPYHVVNVLLHYLAGVLMFFIVHRIMEWSRFERTRINWVAGFAAALFLLHPVQTEAVAYLAGRSETLSVMLFLAAYTVFLYRRTEAVSWSATAAVFLLFAAALLSKEHTIVLPALLLLTDYWWNPGFSLAGIRRNWRLYGPMVIGGVAGVAYFVPLLLHGGNAGFGLKDFTWYQYFFTQCRALFVYPLLFVIPAHQNADWSFPISKTPLDGGAIFGLIALLALAVAAWHYRRKFPLASFGFFAYLLLMAPTSSIVPIKDALAERRLYISMLGLLLIVAEVLGRLKLSPQRLATACACLALVYAGVAHARAEVWSSELALWQDTAAKSPDNYRAHFQLGSAYYNAGNCSPAEAEFQKAAQLQQPGYDLLVDWGLAYDCMHQPEQALAKLRQAAALSPTAHVYTQIAKVYADSRQWDQVRDALENAVKLDPNFAATYLYRGKLELVENNVPAAIQDLRQALRLDPTMTDARQDLALAESRLRPRR